MDEQRLAGFHVRLGEILAELDSADHETREGRAVVALDQQSVGRLSRMDALQRQAMAQATHSRRQQQRLRVKAALARIRAREYGVCVECGDDISPARLDSDPTLPRCINCTRG